MLTLSTDSLKGYGLNRIFELAKEAGYDGIDLQVEPDLYDTQNTEYIRKLSKEYELPIQAVKARYDANSPREVTEAIEMAKELDAKVVVIQPPKLLNFKFVGWLKKEIPKLRTKERISIALENAPSKTFLGIFPERALSNLAELKEFKHACIDTSRVAEKSEDIMRVYKSLRNYLVHIHLSNVNRGKKYAMPQEGILPLESLLAKLKQDQYPGAISIKVKPKFLDAGNDEKVIKHLKECKEFYEKYYVNVDA
ncbi:MAG: sugar phosphate isomerase/epimerase [Patescibacteria group bacterium]|nr:sugar phosphate isomerase/epimerase [Patescibacteria group bacterium]